MAVVVPAVLVLGAVPSSAATAVTTKASVKGTYEIYLTSGAKTKSDSFLVRTDYTWTVGPGTGVAGGTWSKEGKVFSFVEVGGSECSFSGTHNKVGFNRATHQGRIHCAPGGNFASGKWYAVKQT